MKSRKIGIDLIKIVAMIFVPCLHYFSNSGFLEQPYTGIDKIILVSARMIAMSCIGLFIASTGYLQYKKEFSIEYVKKIKSYIVVYLIYCCLTSIYMSFIHVNDLKDDFLYRIFQFPEYYWYMAFFIGFYLLIPFFNNIIRELNEKQFKEYLWILFFIIAVPEFINGIPAIWKENDKVIFLPNWWKELFPLLYYSLGAYYGKYQLKIKKFFWIIVMIMAQVGISIADYFFC